MIDIENPGVYATGLAGAYYSLVWAKKLRVVGTRTGAANNGRSSLLGTPPTGANNTLLTAFPDACSEICVAHAGWYLDTLGEADQPGLVSLSNSLETTFGTNDVLPFQFGGSNFAGVTPRGDHVVSNPIPIDISAGALRGIRTNATVTDATLGFALQRSAVAALGERSDRGAPISNKTFGNRPATAGGTGLGPLAILGIPADYNTRCVALITDSNGVGTGDTTGDANGNLGLLERGLNRAIAWTSLGRAGNRITYWLTRNYGQLAFCRDHVTDALCQLGFNDITSGASNLAQTQANMLLEWSALKAVGCRVSQTTMLPNPSLVGGWATGDWTVLANQTAGTTEAVRVPVNDWLRDGAPIVAGVAVAVGTVGALRATQVGHPLGLSVFDIADQVESSRNSGLYRIDLGKPSLDGSHLTSVLHAQAATAINVAQLRAA